MVSLFAPISGDYASRSAELARQQKLAQMLMEMSQQEMPVSTAGGITAPVSPYGALAKALTSFGGSYLSGKSAADEADLKKSDQEMAQAALKNFYALPDFQQLALSKQPAAPTSFDINVPSLPGQVGPQDVAASVALPGVSRSELATVAGRATTPQEQMQKLAPLMQGGETSRSVYNAFMPQVMQQQAANIKANREDKLPNPVVVDGVLVDGNPKSDTYGQNITQRKAETPKPPSTRTYKSGNTEITEQFNPETGEYERLATSPIRVAGDGNRQPPSGYKWNNAGNLEPIPGGPADPGVKKKTISPSLMRLENDDIKDVQLAGGIISDMNSFAKKIDEGKLNLGVLSNLFSRAELATGLAGETAKEYGSFKAQLEKLRNDSLRLNKGTQTEGDAVRAWNELFSHINDEGFVRKRIDEIAQINKRAQAQRIMLINERREMAGHDPIDESKYLVQPSAYGNQPSSSGSSGKAKTGVGFRIIGPQ